MLVVRSDELGDHHRRHFADLVGAHSLDSTADQSYLAIALIVIRRGQSTAMPLVIVHLDVEPARRISEVGVDRLTVQQVHCHLRRQVDAAARQLVQEFEFRM